MTDEELITQKIAGIAATANQFPCVIIVHNIRTASVEYMSDLGLKLLQTTAAELRAMGPAYHERFFNQAEAVEYVPKLFALVEQNDLDAITSFMQQVRTTESSDWSWYFTTMRLLLQGNDGKPLLFICFACPIDPDSHVTMKVKRLLDENNFLRQHAGTFALLTPRERDVLRQLALGHSSAEIGEALHMSAQTADTHRRNIRQKLNTTSTFELGQYARAFNLI